MWSNFHGLNYVGTANVEVPIASGHFVHSFCSCGCCCFPYLRLYILVSFAPFCTALLFHLWFFQWGLQWVLLCLPLCVCAPWARCILLVCPAPLADFSTSEASGPTHTLMTSKQFSELTHISIIRVFLLGWFIGTFDSGYLTQTYFPPNYHIITCFLPPLETFSLSLSLSLSHITTTNPPPRSPTPVFCQLVTFWFLLLLFTLSLKPEICNSSFLLPVNLIIVN